MGSNAYQVSEHKLLRFEGSASLEVKVGEVDDLLRKGDISQLVRLKSSLSLQAGLLASFSNSFVTIRSGVRTPTGEWYPVDNEQQGFVTDSKWYQVPTKALRELHIEASSLGFDLSKLDLVQYKQLKSSEIGSYVVELERGTAPESVQNGEVRIHGELYPYQLQGLKYVRLMAATSPGCLIADEMGLGKTLQAIAFLSERSDLGLDPALVVMPGSLLGNWQREIAKFAPSLRVLRHSGAARSFEVNQFENFDVVLVSYELVVNDFPLLSSVTWSTLVVDEAQYIKNPGSQRANFTKKLSRGFALAITGTPFETSLQDYWSIMDFVSPGFLGDADKFEQAFSLDEDSASLLRRATRPLFIRRLVDDVAQDLPPRFEIPEWIPMGDELVEMQTEIIEGQGNALTKVNAIVLLSQHGGKKAQQQHFVESRKLARALELLREIFANGEKAIVFANYDFAIEGLVEEIKSNYPFSFVEKITGAVSVDDRLALIDKLGKADSGVLVINPTAGGVGLNIYQANHVIHFSPLWNPALREQATKRAHRNGQERPVFVRHLLYENSIEEVMWKRQTERMAINEVLMESNELSYKEILEDLRLLNAR